MAVLLVIQSLSAIDLSFFQIQAVYADTEALSEQNSALQEYAGEMQKGEALTNLEADSGTIQNTNSSMTPTNLEVYNEQNNTELVNLESLLESDELGLQQLDVYDTDLSGLSNQLSNLDTLNTTSSAISIPSDGTDTTNDVLADNSILATTPAAISVPENIDMTATDTTLTVSWDAVDGAQSYDVSLNGNEINISTNNYTYDGLETNTLYTVMVRAVCNEEVRSDWSSEQSKYTLLSTPVNLKTTTVSSTSVSLTWDTVIGATGYEIYRNNISLGNFDANTYTDTDCVLTANTSYTYSVKAYNDYNVSAISKPCETRTAITIPANINVIATATTLEVSWDAVAGAQSYDVLLGDDVINILTNNYTFKNLEPNTSYKIKVRAAMSGENGLIGDLNGDGVVDSIDFALFKKYILDPTFDFPVEDDMWAADLNGDNTIDSIDFALFKKYILDPNFTFPKSALVKSEWSEEKVKFTLLSTPNNLKATKISGISFKIDWDAVVGATYYEIYRDSIMIQKTSTNSYLDNELELQKTYEYRVKACNEVNLSEASDATIVTTPDDDYGNDISSAYLVEVEVDLPGSISGDDMDFFKITLPVIGEYKLYINPVGDTYLIGYVYNSSGTLKSTYNIDAYRTSHLTINNSNVNTTYYLKLTLADSSVTGDFKYNLNLTYKDIQAPSVPANLAVSRIVDGTAYFVWSPSSDDMGVTGYELYRDGNLVKTVTGDICECSDGGLSPLTTYSYTVKAFDDDGNKSLDSQTVSVSTGEDIQAPTAPTNLSASSITARSLSLTWIASTDNFNVERYEIYNGSSKIDTSTGTNCTLIGLTPGTAFIFTVKAVDASDNVSSASNAVTVTTLEDDYGDDINNATDIDIGVDVPAVINSYGDIDFFKIILPKDGTYKISSYNGTPYPIGYLYSADGTLIASGNIYISTITADLRADTAYYLKVTAHNNQYIGEYKIKVTYIDNQAPTAPENLAILSKDDSTVHLTWSPATDNIGVTGYELYRDGNLIKTVNGDVLQYSDTGLTPLTTYSYTVKAFDAAGNRSLDSQLLSVTTDNDDEAPTAPTNLAASSITARSLTLKWTASTDNYNVARYEIYNESSKIAISTVTNYTVTGLTPATLYTFMVKAVDSSENISTTSSAITVTTLEDDYGDDINSASPIDLGTDVFAAINFNGDVDFFKFTPKVDGYYNFLKGIKIENNSLFECLYNSDGNYIIGSNFLNDWHLDAGKTYYFKVENLDNETVSYIVNIHLLDKQAPSTPENLNVSTIAEGTAYITWSPSNDNIGVAGYKIYRNGILINTVTGLVCEYSDTGLSPGNTYFYTIKSFDEDGNISEESNPLSVTVINRDDFDYSIPLQEGVDLHGEFNYNGDVDFYSFIPNIDGTYKIQSTGNMDTYGYLYDSNKITLDYNDDSGVDNNFSITKKLKANQTYYIKVMNYYNTGTGSYCINVTAIDDQNPTTPTNLAIESKTYTTVSLIWNVSTDNVGVVGYDVYRDNLKVGTAISTEYVDTGLMPGTTYTYMIKARDALGNTSSASDFISAETDPDYEVPTVPTNLEITAKTCSTISLSWNKSTDNSAIAGYEVYRNSSMVATTTTNLLNYTDSELMPNTTYEYTVKAKDIAGNISADSNSVSETTSLDTEPPIVPGKITVISKSDTTITISWLGSKDNASVSGYEIYRDGFKITTSSGISFTDTGLNANTTYTYSIKAYDGSGNISDASESMDVTTYLLATPNVVATGYSSSILLSWNAVEGATDYEIKFDTGISNIGNVTSYIHSDLNPSTRYYYEIRAKAGNETSNWSTVNCYTAPYIPTNIKVTPSANYVSISWDRSYGSYSYDIEDNGNIVGSTTQTNFLHYNLSPSTQHTYKVRAKNSSTSEWSIPVTTMTLLNRPSNITYITSSSAITINWPAVEKATEYEIEMDGQIVYSDSNTTFVHENLLPNTEYTYKLRAKNDLVTSEWVNISETTKLEMPKNIIAKAEDTRITFTWDPVSGASKYIVELNSPNEYKVPTKDSMTSSANFSTDSNILTIDRLYPCTNYTYRVYADGGEISEYGTIKTPFWTAKNITSYTTDLTAEIHWDSVGDMMEYDVCVDGEVIDLGTTREYAESNLIPGTEHIYKVRARNENEGYISDWTEIKCSTLLNYSPGTWSNGVGMPGSRVNHGTVSLNGKLYVFGGRDSDKSVLEYNPDTGVWKNKSEMINARVDPEAVTANNKIYIVGGGWCDNIEEYDPLLDKWKITTNLPIQDYVVAAVAMNEKIYVVFAGGALFEYNSLTNIWVQKAYMPTARYGCGAAVVNNKLYVIGGSNDITDFSHGWGYKYYSAVEEYDPAMDKWTKKANMPTGCSAFGTAALNGKIYAIGSYRGRNQTQEYTPSTDTWSVKSTLGPYWKGRPEAAELNGKIYLTGGYDDNSAFYWLLGSYTHSASVYVFEPDKTTWSTNTYIPKNRSEYASAALNGKIYVMGGRNNGSTVKTVDEYDIKTKTWTRKADMPTARYSFSAIALNGKIYVVGGADDSGLLNVFEEYDPENDIWVRKKDFTLKASSPGVTTACGKIYVVVGEYGSIPWDYSPILEYNPDTDIWKSLGEMKTNRSDFAIASANDKIYTFGGYSYWGREDVAEEFDPKTNTWTSLPFSCYRRNAKAVGINGKIYLMGGDDFGNVSSTVEEFDPATKTLRNIEYMTQPRYPENAVAVDNKIYIISGEYGNSSLFNSIESYTVAGLQFSPGSSISNFTEQVEDIRIESNVLPMSFSRTYNSGLNYEKTMVGNGWRTNYDSSVSKVQESGKVIAGALNVREEPWGEISTQISKNTIVKYLYKNAALQSDGRYWHYVQLPDGTKGYVAAWYIQDITGLEVTYSSGSRTVFENENGLYKAPYGTYDKLDAIDQGYKLTTKEQTKYYYNIDGKLIAVEDKSGNKHTIHYNSENKPSKVIDFAGKSITFTYTDGKLADITDSNGRNVSYSYDTYGNLTSVTDPIGNQTTYNYYLEYKDDGSLKSSRLKQIIDTYGNQIKKNEYDLFGRLKKQYDGINNAKSYSYSDIKLDENSLYDSAVFNQYSINEKGNSSKTALNLATQKPLAETDSEGRTAYYKYYVDLNCDGKWTDITNLRQGTSLYSAYNIAIQQGNKPTKEEITDRNGNVTIYETDARGNTIKITNPDSSYKEFEYDINNNLIKCKDEEQNCTYYIYDEATNTLLQKKVQPLNGTDDYLDTSDQTKFSITYYNYYNDTECNQLGYKAKGLVKTMTDPDGNTEIYTYTNDGNVRTVSNLATGIIATFEYYSEGWKKAEISPKEIRTEYIYDRNGRIEKVVLNSSDTTRYIYDNVGRKIKEISPKQYDPSLENLELKLYNGDHGYRYDYYADGKVSAIKDPENNTTEYTYDACGNLKTETKPNGSIYQYEYDVMNRLARLYFKNSKDSTPILLEEYWYSILDDGRTQKTYKKYINESEISTLTSIYDYAGRLISQTNPDGTSTSTVYNANGTVNYTTDAKGNSTYYRYDGLNRLTEQWTPFEKINDTVKYTYQKIVYDKAGKKLQEKTGKTTVAKDVVPTGYIAKNYEYNANGKVDTITQSDETGTIFGKTKYEYDADGNISKEIVYTDADNTNITEYNYNYMGKVSEKKVHVKAGDLEGYDFTSSEGKILLIKYTYDKNGNLETKTTPEILPTPETTTPIVTTTYTYDNMNRQTGVSQPGIDEDERSVTISSSTEYDWQGNKVRTTDANGNDTRYLYNKRGLLEKTTTETKDALGNIVKTNTTALYYDRAGRLTAEVAANDYDPTKTLDQMNRVEYTYDLMGRVKTKTYVGEENRVDPTNNFGWTTQQVRIVQKAYQYDENGNVIKELDALRFEAATDKTNIDTQISTGYGTEYNYNLANKLETVLDAETKARNLGFTTKYGYDALGRTITETNANGIITKYSYDGAGNVIAVAIKKSGNTPEQTLKTNTYDYTGKLLTETSYQSATALSTITFEYNALGQVRKTVYPSDASIPENIVKYQYDVMGRLKTQWDTKGAVDAYTYNNQGDVLSHTQKKQDNTEEITTLTRYDENGNARFVFDGNEKCTTYTYNEQNKVTSSSKSASGIVHETTYTYDANGNQIAVSDWRGNTTTYVYDSLNRLIETIDSKEKSIQKLEYNHNNVQEKSYDALNKATVYTYDRNNRLLTTTDPGFNATNYITSHTTSQTYDNMGNIATKTDGRGNETPADGKKHTTTYTYDEFNRLKTVVNAKNETTEYTYDLSGNLLTQKDGKGNTTTYEYNVANKAIKSIDQGGRTVIEGNYTYIPAKTETYTYNADGSLASKKDREGNTTVYVYDIHGRLQSQSIQIQNTTGSAISFTYDDNGNQLTMTDSTGTTVRTYDELGRVLTKTVPDIGTTYFQYDIISGMDEGCYAEITTDPKGHVTQKIFDKVGRLITVTAGGKTTIYNYYNNGARESITYNDGTKDTAIEEYTYYGDGLLWTLTNTKLDAAGNTIIDSYSYTYDAANNQTSKTDAKGVTSYTYDVLNRLETVTEPSGTLEAPSTTTTAYTYDAAGNRETETITKGTQITVNTYIYNEQNRLIRVETKVAGTLVTTTLYEYDDNGNQLNTTVNETITVVNEYDCWNQLITTMTNTGTTINAYNGEGYRVSKTVKGTLTRYLYEGDKVVLELDSSGNETARNVYGSNLIMREAIRTDGLNVFDTYFYLYNGHADVTALLKPDGNIAATYYYDAFGNITATGSANNNITFAGYQYDAETGLYYLNARMYDPKTARFLQEDTYLGDRNDPLSLNLYTYCANNPIIYYDPTGHFFREIRNGFNWLGNKIFGNSKPTTSKAAITAYEPDWADKADDFLEGTGDKIKAGMLGFADKFGAEPISRVTTRIMFKDWTPDYSKTPNSWKPAITEADKKKEHIEMLRDQLGKGYNWTPDKSIENAYNIGGITGQITQAATIGKVLRVAGVGGQLASWGQKAKFFGSTGAISGAINAYGEGKDTAGIIQESAITGTVSVPLGFAGEYVGNQVGNLIQKSVPSLKKFVSGINRGISNAGEGTSSAVSSVHPGKLAAESSEISYESVMRSLRQSGTPEGYATSSLLKRGKAEMILEQGKAGGILGEYLPNTNKFKLYTSANSSLQGAAGTAAHESMHVLQKVVPGVNYTKSLEYDAYLWQKAVDKTWPLRTDQQIWDHINTYYKFLKK